MQAVTHPHQARTFCNYATGLANIVADKLQINHAGQSIDPRQRAKQDGLNNFAILLNDNPATDAHVLLQHGMNGIRIPDNPQMQSVQKLFDNRTVFHQKCTESAALAMAAFAVKVFGSTLVENERIDHDRLNMAMRTLFGNDIDELGGAIKYSFKVNVPPNSTGYILSSSHYTIEVSPTTDQQQRDEQISALVTSENLDCGYFHSRTISSVAQLFRLGDSMPGLLFNCIGLDFRDTVKITKRNAATEITRLSAEMNRGDLAHSSTSTTILSNGTDVISTVTSRYFADSNPSILRKVQKYLDPGQNYSWVGRVINATSMEHTLRIGTDTVTTEKHVFAAVNSIEEATKIVAGVFGDGAMEQGKKYLFTDIRLLNRGKPDERALYEKHVEFMGQACARRGITYCPYLQEAHSSTEHIASAIGHATFLPRYTYSGAESGTYNNSSLKREYELLFQKLPASKQAFYRHTMELWSALYDQGEVVDGGVPFVTLTQTLGRVFARNTSDNLITAHGKGCKSAKDRATSVGCGELMFETVLETEFHQAHHDGVIPNIRRFFQGQVASGHLNYDALPPNYRLLLKRNFDRHLLHSANLKNTGTATNVSTYPLATFYSEVPFIANAEIHTVDVGN